MGLFNKKHSVGKVIAELRKEKGWTQVELAEKLQVSDKAVSKWEKDDAFPSVEFFPVLAELFGVSIDYLMTGKKAEPQVVTMSKAELCAKNDDPELLRDINLTTKDENGKTVIDYVVEYESLKVFNALARRDYFLSLQRRCGLSKSEGQLDALTLLKFALITNSISLLNGSIVYKNNYAADDIKSLMPVEEKDCFSNQPAYVTEACIINEELLDIIVLDKRVTNETIDYLLSNQKGRKCVWYLVLPYLLHQAYLHNNDELLNKVIDVSIISNEYAYKNLTLKYDSYYGYNYEFKHFFVVSKNGYGKVEHGLVRVLEKTIKLALERSDIATLERLNRINSNIMNYYGQFKCYVADSDEIRIAKLKLDKSVSATEIAIQSTIHNGIVCIDELMAINDFSIFKKTLTKYPIHIVEALMDMLKNNRLRDIYRFAIDENDSSLATLIIKEDIEGVKKHIGLYWRSDNKFATNLKHLFTLKNNRRIDIYSTTRSSREYKTIDAILTFIEECRQRIIYDFSLKFDKEKTIGDLTKDYFEKELEKGNIEIVIIKLCVRLEAILRSDYNYEGDFSDMLNKYCSGFNTYDDEGNDYDPHTPRILNKLRMQRNGIVHSEKCKEALTIDEIKFCIDYICKMG